MIRDVYPGSLTPDPDFFHPGYSGHKSTRSMVRVADPDPHLYGSSGSVSSSDEIEIF
jgi:hypothetical protein